MLFTYQSRALKEAFEARQKEGKIPLYHDEYTPNFTRFQYDMEMFIFYNYDKLRARELEIGDNLRIRAMEEFNLGPCLLPREQHLANAFKIRWPEKILANGQALTGFALTPWAMDYLWGLANYKNVVTFGGGGQGKTFTAIAFALCSYEYFSGTKSGAQCSFSTVSQKKLDQSIWSHLVKLDGYKLPYSFSNYQETAIKSSDYTFIRKNEKGKRIEQGGTMRGILLVQGAQTSKEIDKLTGQHDVNARIYLLDEAQSTGPAPLSAYNNMFIHPTYGWFQMAGNFGIDGDLLEENTRPNDGWSSVDEFTHMWESSLRSPESDLGHKSLVIHYNNNLSPAFTDPEMLKKYSRFLPTPEKKKRLYPLPENEETIAAKRFWVGFRYEKEESTDEIIITKKIISEFGAHNKQDFRTLYRMASLDTAPSNRDRNILTILNVGLSERGFPRVAPHAVIPIKKPESQKTYYKETSKNLYEALMMNNVKSGDAIMDWTNRTQILEAMSENYDFTFHHLVYNENCPDGVTKNSITEVVEERIEIECISTFTKYFEHSVRIYAHERFVNRISLGAYLLRMFIEQGAFLGLNEDNVFRLIADHKGFEREICSRSFIQNAYKNKWSKNVGKIRIDPKEEFKAKFKFSPDILDTLYQAAWFLYVIKGVNPKERGLGDIIIESEKPIKVVDRSPWDARMRFRRN